MCTIALAHFLEFGGLSAGEWMISKRSMATTVAEELLIGCFTSVLGHPDFTVSSERMAKIKTLAEKLLAEIKTEKGSKALKNFASKVSAVLREALVTTVIQLIGNLYALHSASPRANYLSIFLCNYTQITLKSM